MQVLCKTYKKDAIFAGSLVKLLARLEDEVVAERARLERTEEKKRRYKQLARQFYYDVQSKLDAQQQEFEQVRAYLAGSIAEQETLIQQLRAEKEQAQGDFNSQIAQFEQQLKDLQQSRDASFVIDREVSAQQNQKLAGSAAQYRRLTNLTLKSIMKSESKAAIDAFLRRFKSIQNFDPLSQVPKMMKYT